MSAASEDGAQGEMRRERDWSWCSVARGRPGGSHTRQESPLTFRFAAMADRRCGRG